MVEVPENLEPGEYVLSFRWDCQQSPQVWNSCANIQIVWFEKYANIYALQMHPKFLFRCYINLLGSFVLPIFVTVKRDRKE